MSNLVGFYIVGSTSRVNKWKISIFPILLWAGLGLEFDEF